MMVDDGWKNARACSRANCVSTSGVHALTSQLQPGGMVGAASVVLGAPEQHTSTSRLCKSGAWSTKLYFLFASVRQLWVDVCPLSDAFSLLGCAPDSITAPCANRPGLTESGRFPRCWLLERIGFLEGSEAFPAHGTVGLQGQGDWGEH